MSGSVSVPDNAYSDDDLKPSKLGTKEYWDSVYEAEVKNFEDFGDEGEVWFGEDSVGEMVNWALVNVPPCNNTSPSSTVQSHPPKIIEIGSGNGNLLFALVENRYRGERMVGIDYSADAVRLAQNISRERGGGYETIRFAEVDFLAGEKLSGLPIMDDDDGWDLVLDKGTYDAMALAARDAYGERKSPRDVYPKRIGELLKDGGFFLITSCNFTREELLETFQTSETRLVFQTLDIKAQLCSSQIEFPSISFGGVQGSTYCGMAFQKIVKEE